MIRKASGDPPAVGCTGASAGAGLAGAPANCDVMTEAGLLGSEAVLSCIKAAMIGCADDEAIALGTFVRFFLSCAIRWATGGVISLDLNPNACRGTRPGGPSGPPWQAIDRIGRPRTGT